MRTAGPGTGLDRNSKSFDQDIASFPTFYGFYSEAVITYYLEAELLQGGPIHHTSPPAAGSSGISGNLSGNRTEEVSSQGRHGQGGGGGYRGGVGVD